MNAVISANFSDHFIDNVATTAPDHVLATLDYDKNGESSVTADKNKSNSNRKPTASATAKFLLRWARDSVDAFGPLKSVAGGLCFILENCEVWPKIGRAHV